MVIFRRIFRDQFLIFCLLMFVLAATGVVVGQEKAGFVNDGESFGSILIGKSTFDDVIAAYGGKFKETKHRDYSTEISYEKLGLSFYTCQADPKREVFVVKISKPNVVTTVKGIVLGTSTLEDVARLYGLVNESNGGTDNSGFEYPGVTFRLAPLPVAISNTIPEPTESIAKSGKETSNSGNPTDLATLRLPTEKNSVTGVTPRPLIIDGQVFELDLSSLRRSSFNVDANDDNQEAGDGGAEKLEKEEAVVWSPAMRSRAVIGIELTEPTGLRQCEVKFRKLY